MKSIQFASTLVKLLLKPKSVVTYPSLLISRSFYHASFFGRPKKTATTAVKLAELKKKYSNVNR